MSNIFYIIGLGAMIWVIYDVWTQNNKLNGTQKIAWTIAAFFLNIIAAVVYYFTQKR